MRLPGGGRVPGRTTFSPDQLQRKYKHAPAFGVTGPYSPANSRRFEQALRSFLEDAAVATQEGTMRGQPGKVIFHYDEVTRQCVATTKDGDFISGWMLSPRQLAGVIERGHLGGG